MTTRHRLALAARWRVWRERFSPMQILAGGLLVLLSVSLFGTNQQTEQQRDATAAQARTLAEEIRGECDTGRLAGPVCGTAAQVVAEPIPGPAGAAGLPGVPGRDGKDGVSPPCLSEPSRCEGADGAPGAAGAAGEPGADGMDGKDGADGADGAPGRDGSPAASWTSTFPDGSTQTCTRSGGPDTAPTYECQPVLPPPDDDPPPTEGGGLLGG